MSKIIFEHWNSFVIWGRENGYDESYFNPRDSKCLDLYETFLKDYWYNECTNPNQ